MNLYPPKGIIFIPGRPVSNTRYQPPRPINTQTLEHDNVLNSSRKNSDIDYFSFPCFDELKTCNFGSGGVQNLSTANRRLEDILFHGKNISQSESRVTAGRLISKADPNGQNNKSTTYLVHHPCLDSCSGEYLLPRGTETNQGFHEHLTQKMVFLLVSFF